MEIKLVKVGNHYINVLNIERFAIQDDGIYLYTISGSKFRLTEKLTKDDTFAMKRIIRKINEKAYDIIYIEDFVKHDEAFRS